MSECTLCPRQCRAQRAEEHSGGFCAMPLTLRVARAALHFWEEPPISGTRGSGAVFFSGCSLRCCFCQNHELSERQIGEEITPSRLAEIMRRLEGEGAHNINLVTGTHFAPLIAAALDEAKLSVPVVWNCSGYETEETIMLLKPYISIWLPDIKYALPETAREYSRAPDYPEVAFAAVRLMQSLRPELVLREDGTAAEGVIVRHLVLPGNTANSIAVLERIKRELLPNTVLSLMSQYTPCRETGFKELNRRVTRREYEKVCLAAEELGIDGYAQDMSSASKCYVPDFKEKLI